MMGRRVPVIGRLYSREYLALVFGFLFIAFESFIRSIIYFLPHSVILWFHDRTRQIFNALAELGGGVRGQAGLHDEEYEDEMCRSHRVRSAVDFAELCAVHGYEWEEHVVQTRDGYLLGLHRISHSCNESASASTGKRRPVVYMHHGLMMCSDIFLCTTRADHALPLVLADAGYDVWLGNNRGNKYSRKHCTSPSFPSGSPGLKPHEAAFWDFCLDEFATHDVPAAVEYVLRTVRARRLAYIGFSQGAAQGLAALALDPELNEKIAVFVALAPATSPPGLRASLVDGLMKASPTLIYLFFGRRSILSSAPLWQQILYPPIWTCVIDRALHYLFAWTGANITLPQKRAAYAHLYSTASTKSVVHWFQIMRNAEFTMFDDDASSSSPAGSRSGAGKIRFVSSVATNPFPSPSPRSSASTSLERGDSRTTAGVQQPQLVANQKQRQRSRYYCPARFPTRNIRTPIVLLYGTSDSLVDICVMRSQLPPDPDSEFVPALSSDYTSVENYTGSLRWRVGGEKETAAPMTTPRKRSVPPVTVIPLEGYEHLDVLWGKDVDKDVFPHVLEALRTHLAEKPVEASRNHIGYRSGLMDG